MVTLVQPQPPGTHVPTEDAYVPKPVSKLSMGPMAHGVGEKVGVAVAGAVVAVRVTVGGVPVLVGVGVPCKGRVILPI